MTEPVKVGLLIGAPVRVVSSVLLAGMVVPFSVVVLLETSVVKSPVDPLTGPFQPVDENSPR